MDPRGVSIFPSGAGGSRVAAVSGVLRVSASPGARFRLGGGNAIVSIAVVAGVWHLRMVTLGGCGGASASAGRIGLVAGRLAIVSPVVSGGFTFSNHYFATDEIG